MIIDEKTSNDWLDDIKIKVGDFTIDFKQTRLYKDDEVIKLEPLTMELLCYLVKRKGHYVSQRELLENVWDGRIVSDNAIRRVVKKLRDALGDDVKAASYIKTVPTKGYLLIAEVIQTKNATVQNDSIVPQIDNQPTEISQPITNPEKSHKLKGPKYKIIMILSLSILIGIAYFYFSSTWQSKSVIVKSLTDMPGEESWADYNKKNNIIVFSHRKTASGYYNLYLKTINTNTVRRITSGSANHYAAKWDSTGKQLAFQRQSGQQIEIMLMTFDDDMKIKNEKSLFKYSTLQPNLFWSPDNNLLYFTDRQSINHPRTLFSINIKTSALKQITFPDIDGGGDYSAQISPNGNYLGVLRHMQFNRVHLFIYNMRTGKVEDNRKIGFSPVSLTWDEKSKGIYLAANETLHYYSLKTQSFTKNQLDKVQLGAVFGTCGKNCLLANSKGKNTRDIAEVVNPFILTEQTEMFEFPLPGKEGSPSYTINQDEIIFITSKKNISQIVKYSTSGELTQLTHFTNNHKITDLSYNPVSNKILGVLDQQVFIWDIEAATLNLLSNQMEKAERPNWTANGKEVYYSRKEHDHRSLMKYSLIDKSTHKLKDNVLEAKEDANGHFIYMLLGSGELVQVTKDALNNFNHIADIPVDSNISWHLHKQDLYFSSPLGTDFLLNKISLGSKQKSLKLWLKNTYYARFDMHSNGNKLLLMKDTLPNSDILQININ